MRHLHSGRKLQRTSSHRKALMSNLATALFEHKRIRTTEAKAKELRPFAERLITRAKNAMLRERGGSLTGGQTVDIHARRTVGKLIRDKAVLEELFETIAPVVESRNGGYTRIVKTGRRRGDGSRTAIIELVDWAEEQDGIASLSRANRRREGRQAQSQGEAVQEALEESVEAAIETFEDAVEEEAPTASDTDTTAEEPQAQAAAAEEAQEQPADEDAGGAENTDGAENAEEKKE